MRNKIIIFLVLFIVAVAIMTSTNDNIDISIRYDEKLLEKLDVTYDNELMIHLNNTTNNQPDEYKVEVVENSELKDSVEIYRNMFFEQVDDDYKINIDGNNITIIDNLNSITVYCEQPFISIENSALYMSNFPNVVYKIYIPQGMEYSFQY